MICNKGTWTIFGGDFIGGGVITRICAVCDCGCDSYIQQDKKYNFFETQKECQQFLEWELAKTRVNRIVSIFK